MVIPLLTLPPEILLQIFSKLSIQPLLRFAQTSHYARSLAYTDIDALSLTIYPSHQSSWHDKLSAARFKPEHDLHAAIRIPQAWNFPYKTLLTFHNKMIASILKRHALTLQKIDLTLWTLSPTIAHAIAGLPALMELSIRIESVQPLPRVYINVQERRREECTAWSLLASSPSWAHSLNYLRIENAEVNTSQLLSIIHSTVRLQDLRLSACSMLTSSIWDASQLPNLHHLEMLGCANIHINEPALTTISKMRRLQVRQFPFHYMLCWSSQVTCRR